MTNLAGERRDESKNEKINNREAMIQMAEQDTDAEEIVCDEQADGVETDRRGGEGRLNRRRANNKRRSKRAEIRVSTWNVRTLLAPGRLREVESELGRYRIDIAAVQETRWMGQGEIDGKYFTVRYSGGEKQGQHGVAFIIGGRLRNNVMEFKPINERMAYLRVETKPFNMSILNLYAPTERAKEKEKEKFYEEVEEAIEGIPKEDTMLILGDLNAQIGKEEYLEEVAGKHTIHEDTNDNGHRLCDLAARTNLVIGSTKHEHPKRHKVTWVSPDKKTCTQIDHVMITRRRQSSLKDVRTYRGACADSDHYMVTATIRQKLKRTAKAGNSEIKWDIEELHSLNIRKRYSEEVAIQVNRRKTTAVGIEKEWNEIRGCICQSAEENIGVKKRESKKEWYNEECQEMLERKIKARQQWLKTNRGEDREAYEKVRKESNRTIRRSKREWINDGVEEIEKDSTARNARLFYKGIRGQSRTYKGKIGGIKDDKGRVTENINQYKEVWAEHFKQLLNDPEINEETDIEDEEIMEPVMEPTMEEVAEIINKSRNGKAPGKDGINMELIKYGGEKLQEQVHMLIKKIWREENMPEEWRTGQIIPIHKKGDQQICKNYRGITLLNTTYKILSTLIQKRLANQTRDIIGQYQCGFTRGRSTIDAIHIIKQIMEKAYEHKIQIEMLFIDFQQAFDSINRRKLMLALKELGINPKLRRLIQMTMNRTTVSIKTQKGETEEFEVNKGVRQGDSLSATLFNLALEYVVRKINKGTLRTKGGQIIAYADDIVLVTKRRRIMKDMINEIIEEGKEIGLRLNEDKTKIMRFGRKVESGAVKIGEHTFEEVETFKYLGVTISSQGERETEIQEKVLAANRAFHANKKLLKSNILRRETKMRIYRTIIRPVLMYAGETMTMTKKDEEKLRVIERKILRAILGPVKVSDSEYRSRMNHELLQEMEGGDIVKKIKEQRVRWLGHIWRAGTGSTVYAMLEWDPGGRRKRGRPRLKWMQEVTEDLSRAGVTNWREKTADRRLWREIIRRV